MANKFELTGKLSYNEWQPEKGEVRYSVAVMGQGMASMKFRDGTAFAQAKRVAPEGSQATVVGKFDFDVFASKAAMALIVDTVTPEKS